MPCFHPIQAHQLDSGEIGFSAKHRTGGAELLLPCGRCLGCRLERSRQWAARIMFEAQMHAANSFITLTYDDAHVPFPPSLDHSHFQKFMKRARKDCGPLRFYMCGEYGPENFRPHFHACIFGYDFPDRVLWSVNARGDNLYRSAQLEKLWPFGYSSVGELTFDSAAYVARYVLGKISGDAADEHYRFCDLDTGEVSQLVPEYARMSLKPGIGGRWFDLYNSDVYGVDDSIVVNGHRCKPPRYFDKLLRRLDDDKYQLVKDERIAYPRPQRVFDNSPRRLADREEVQKAAISNLSRSLL